MHVTVVLPEPSFTTRFGGYRVHYETANRLAQRGHRVTVLHRTDSPRVRARALLWQLRRRRDFIPWFSFEPSVRVLTVRRVTRRQLAQGVVVFTSGWRTLDDVAKVGEPADAVVLAWDYERWRHAGAKDRAQMVAQFSQPRLLRVAGSVAVGEMFDEMGLDWVGPAPPGIDTDLFRVVRPQSDRPSTVAFLHRPATHRGMEVLFAALTRLHERMPSVSVISTGEPLDRNAPEWIAWRSCPSDHDLAGFYNDASVFVLPSFSEGLGLPALEALACGAALVVTDNGGSRQFARDGENALVVPPGDVSALVEAMVKLLSDQPLRESLATAGRTTVEAMSWPTSIDLLVDLLRTGGRSVAS